MSGEHNTNALPLCRKRSACFCSSASESARLDDASNKGEISESSSVEREDGPSFEVADGSSTFHLTENHLKSLGIELVFDSMLWPLHIIENVFGGPSYVLKYEEIEVKKLKEEIMSNPPNGWKNLKKYKSVSEIFESDLKTLECELTSLNNIKNKFIEGSTWLPPDIHQLTIPTQNLFLRYRFYTMGEQFGRYLLYLAEIKQSGEIITEKMYQNLFNLFIGMFGLFGNLAPPAEKIKIKAKNIVSVPDLIISQAGKIIAVATVKKYFGSNHIEKIEPPVKTCKMNTEQDGQQTKNNLDKHVVGQIGGDMLVHLNSTASNKNTILGIMVQETCVTFTYLEREDVVGEDNEAENSFEQGNYIMKFSKSYNYLDPEEREELIEPLIFLSLLQNNPKFLISTKS